MEPLQPLDLRLGAYESAAMEWVDGVLINALPALIILSVLVAIHPVLRRLRWWRGIGAAWLVVFVATLVVAVTHQNQWSLTCNAQFAPGHFIPSSEPCSATNSLPIWLVALPSLIGLAVLIAWAVRAVQPLDAALRTTGLLLLVALGILLVAQLNPSVALLAFLVAAVGIYASPRFLRARTA
jgi:hypothetical protein